LLPLLYAVIVAGAAFVTLGGGLLLALVSLPLSIAHIWRLGVRRLWAVFWIGVALNGLLFVLALRLLGDAA
jgi:hypothetical protein